ncbi:MAG: TIM barrel protein [Candidatus Omnitrophota bacterium]|jgi:sugar phosphate isomerase/epimerase
MFSLSTSWNASRHNDGFSLVEEIKRMGFNTIELGFSLTQKIVDDIIKMKDSGDISVSSLHNMCPLPADIAPKDASPDYYSLSSLKPEDRARAVSIARNTIDYAKRLDARAVVVHAGRVEMRDKTRKLAQVFDDSEKASLIKSEMLKERAAKSAAHLARLIESLEELIPYSIRTGIPIALETRYYHREMPLIQEFEELFKRFKPGTLFYWHDTGHAETFERLGLARHRDFLDKFANRLIGIHLHDIIGYIDDHNAPGSGTFDFNTLKPYVKSDTIKVIEAHEPATAEDIRKGAEYLERLFGI